MLFFIIATARASIVPTYSLDHWTSGTCTPVTIQTPPGVMGRIWVGTTFGESPHRHGASAHVDGVDRLEVCFPDEVGRNGKEATTLVVYDRLTDDGRSFRWQVQWNQGDYSLTAPFATIVVHVGASQPIVPAKPAE